MTNEELCRRYHETGDNCYLLELYQQNIVLFRRACCQYSEICEIADLLQECFLALVKAVNGYDPEQGAAFITYCMKIVKSHLWRYCMETGYSIRLPERLRGLIKRHDKIITAFYAENGCMPDEIEICDLLDISRKQLKQLRKYSGFTADVKSIDSYIAGDTDGNQLKDIIPADTADSAEIAYNHQLQGEVWEIVKEDCTQAGNDVLRHLYIDEWTIEKTAAVMGISTGELIRIRNKAFKKLFGVERLRGFADYSPCYRGGFEAFKNANYTSCVEAQAIKNIERRNRLMQFIRRKLS